MNIVTLLSLCSAVTYGLSDFVGGLLARRASAWAIAVASQAAATVVTAGVVATNPGDPQPGALVWGAIAGLGSGAGNVLIYRGLGSGRMAVVAPLSAIAAATLPVIVGLLSGERPGVVPVIGVLIALPAIWMVSGGGSSLPDATRRDVLNGLAAGAGFGVQFSALGQIPTQAGLIPLTISQVVSVSSIVAAAVAFAAPWRPRDRASRLGVIAGVLAGIATVCFQLATQHGFLTIAGVLTSLYPAVTVLLATIVLRERIERAQSVGLALAGAAVAMIAAG